MNRKTREQFEEAMASAQKQRHRVIVHVAMSCIKAVDVARDFVEISKLADILWVDHSLKDPVKSLRARLGAEVDVLVLNAYDGLNPNVLGICQGLVKAGGLFVLLTPELGAWPRHPDPDYRRLQIEDETGSVGNHRFIQRFCDLLALAPVIRVTEEDARFPPVKEIPQEAVCFDAQEALIQRIQKVAQGRAWRPLVVEGDRGRGKSTALGIAAANILLKQPHKKIGICSISRAAVNCVFSHAEKKLGAHANTMRYYAPDQLLSERPELDLLIVDEAAAIPVTLLKALLTQYRRIVFSTTVHGYEGNGQGFLLRFQRTLNHQTPQWSKVYLTSPIRYAGSDPLESLVNQILLLKAEAFQPIKQMKARSCRWVSQDELLATPALLEQVFGLLICAHYQTTPDDLRLLMDHPKIRLAIIEQGGCVLAVSMLLAEGGFDDVQCEQLLLQKRRFRGHLLPQDLRNSGFTDALRLKFWRIVRIAVVESLRREKLGSDLLAFVRKSAIAQSIDFLGASFSLEYERVVFWQNNGYQLVKLGSHKNNATGLFSGCMLHPLNDRVASLFQVWCKYFFKRLDYQLLTLNKSIRADVVMCFFEKCTVDVTCLDKALVEDYLYGRVAFENVQYSLKIFLISWLSVARIKAMSDEIVVMIKVLLLGQSVESAVKGCGIAGKKEFESLLRNFLEENRTF